MIFADLIMKHAMIVPITESPVLIVFIVWLKQHVLCVCKKILLPKKHTTGVIAD